MGRKLEKKEIQKQKNDFIGQSQAECNFVSVNFLNLFNELLAMSGILVLQKRHRYDGIPATYIPPVVLKSMRDETIEKFGFQKRMSPGTIDHVMNTLTEFRDDVINTLDAEYRLLSLAKSVSGPERNVIRAVASLLSEMKDVDVKCISESHLISSFIHPFMKSLFAIEEPNKIAHCSNILQEGSDLGKRPDYVVDVTERYQFSFVSCIGEVKADFTSDALATMDFYRLALFAKEMLEK
ncbi:hypothetical protein DM01DRAFT_1052009 [Hesseltinella vesiculosa]|uniref:Uncharacterized protein n=1 Tax=Hesseltinella vesiculosa TaxID=101127 RepID=A0A1X2GGK8_9FUNG|nr:hypothetical protein DM01DRAFT_1052009 [Hesseltinella vesiculosa]